MEDLLRQILSEIKSVNNRLDNIEGDVKDLKEGQSRIEVKLDDLEPKNATRHTEIFDKIDTVSKDVKFIKHKLHETEEDVFVIKDHLKLVK